MCDGQDAIDCDVISLADYESIFNDQLKNIDDQFKTIAAALNNVLDIKKNAVIDMHRKDPRITRHDTFRTMQKMIDNFDAINLEDLNRFEIADSSNAETLSQLETITNTTKTGSKQIAHCRKFSNDKHNVYVCRCERFVDYMGGHHWAYTFLKHPRKIKNKVLKWTLQVPTFNYYVGKVT